MSIGVHPKSPPYYNHNFSFSSEKGELLSNRKWENDFRKKQGNPKHGTVSICPSKIMGRIMYVETMGHVSTINPKQNYRERETQREREREFLPKETKFPLLCHKLRNATPVCLYSLND